MFVYTQRCQGLVCTLLMITLLQKFHNACMLVCVIWPSRAASLLISMVEYHRFKSSLRQLSELHCIVLPQESLSLNISCYCMHIHVSRGTPVVV